MVMTEWVCVCVCVCACACACACACVHMRVFMSMPCVQFWSRMTNAALAHTRKETIRCRRCYLPASLCPLFPCLNLHTNKQKQTNKKNNMLRVFSKPRFSLKFPREQQAGVYRRKCVCVCVCVCEWVSRWENVSERDG